MESNINFNHITEILVILIDSDPKILLEDGILKFWEFLKEI